MSSQYEYTPLYPLSVIYNPGPLCYTCFANTRFTRPVFGTSSSSLAAGADDKIYTSFHYTSPPSYELSLEDFEDYALSRLIVLRKIEEYKIKGVNGSDLTDKLKRTLTEYLPTGGNDRSLRATNARRDLASHFILRLAYCRTEDLRRWLLTQEVVLFRHRLAELEKEDTAGLGKFMVNAKITFDRVPDTAKQDRVFARSLKYNMSEQEFQSCTFYKIPFDQAADLIKSREVFVQGGFAFVPSNKLISIVTARFRAKLSKSLAKAAASFAHIAEDARIGPLLKNMNSQYTGRDFAKGQTGVGELTADNVDEFAKRSMPLCMRQAHVGLLKDKKLKHDSRRQYGLFLKGAGLSMEDNIVFFQKIFTKIMSGDDFNKNYLYNIRHMYGKEGKRQDYTPFSCTSIVMGPRAIANDVGSHHGCPFAHMGETSLNALLGQLQIGSEERGAIMGDVKQKQFQLACAKHFHATHPGMDQLKDDAGKILSTDGVGNHPNAWFMASTVYWKNKDKTKGKVEPKGKEMVKGMASPAATQSSTNAVSPVPS